MSAVAENVFEEIETPIGGVPAEAVMHVWQRVEPLLARVVKPHTGHTLHSVLTNLQMARWQLWIIGDFLAVAITEIQARPAQRVLWSQFVVGDNVDKWLADWEKVQSEYARQHECDAVEFAGRRGWGKFQQRFKDYRPMLVTYRKEL